MQKYKIARIILLFAVSVQMLSCSKTAGDDPAGMDASLALSLLTRNGNGDLALTGEDEFTSLAVYIFNNDNDDLEFSELITDFTPESSASLYTKSVRVTQDKKAGIGCEQLCPVGQGDQRQESDLCRRQLCRKKLYGERTGGDHRREYAQIDARCAGNSFLVFLGG